MTCSSVTNSELCEFDEEDGKEGDQFRLAFSPDMQNWVSYKQNSSNPGQFDYNAIYQADNLVDDGLIIAVPNPFVTQGANPLHVYDANTTPSDGSGCLDPQEPLWSSNSIITMQDWIDGTNEGGLECDTVPDQSDYADKWCYLTVDIPTQAPEAADGLMCVNLHLDYGLKGPKVDADDVGMDDRYDRAGYISPWGSSDALFDTADNTGGVAIADCSVHDFSHMNFEDSDFGTDSVENLNIFKQAAGAFGHAECSENGDPLASFIQLRREDNNAPVYTAAIDQDGYYAAAYAHKGKPTYYKLAWCSDDTCTVTYDTTESFGLQSNGFVQVDLLDLDDTATFCDGSGANLDVISPVYSSGKFK